MRVCVREPVYVWKILDLLGAVTLDEILWVFMFVPILMRL